MARRSSKAKNTDSFVLNFRVSAEDRDQLRRIAEAEDRSVGSVIRLAVRRYIADSSADR